MSLKRPCESRTAYSFFPDELRCVVRFAAAIGRPFAARAGRCARCRRPRVDPAQGSRAAFAAVATLGPGPRTSKRQLRLARRNPFELRCARTDSEMLARGDAARHGTQAATSAQGGTA